MLLRFHQPTGPAAAVASLMVFHRGYAPGHTVERFLPDGSIDLVIELDDEILYTYDNDTLQRGQRCRAAWLSGMRTKPISISVGKGTGMLVISLRPERARMVTHVPMSEIRNRVVDADVIFGSSMNRLRDKLQNAVSPDAAFAHASTWLQERMDVAQVIPCGLIETVDQLRQAPALTTIDRMSKLVGFSAKHLAHLFSDYVGVTPKQYQRIHRFQLAVQAIERNESPDWSKLALDCGFYDQSHFIQEFRSFSGFTPTEYLRSRGSILNYVPVA